MSLPAVLFLVVAAPVLAACLAWLGLETLGSNLLGWFLLVLGVAYPVGGLIYTIIARRPFWKSTDERGTAREEKDDRSFWLILPGFLVTFFTPAIEWLLLPETLPRQRWMQIAGLVVVMLSFLLRVWMRLHIRGLYSGHLEVKTEHHLVQTGPYRFIRHPAYAGLVLMAAGVALGYSSLIGLLAIPVFLLPGLAYRIRVEEKILAEHFGEAYQSYARKTKKLIPGIW